MELTEAFKNITEELCIPDKYTSEDIQTIPDGWLEHFMDAYGITDRLKSDLINCFYLLFHGKDLAPVYRHLSVQKILKDYKPYMLLLSCICNCPEAERNYPLLLKKLDEKFQITEFSNRDENFYLKHLEKCISFYTNKENGKVVECMPNFPRKLNNYSKIFGKDEYEAEELQDKNLLFLWSEKEVYNNELKLLKDSPYEGQVLWVSKDLGDGYGFDILSRDIDTGKEKVIEVKSGFDYVFSLTPREYELMIKATNSSNLIYEIQQFQHLYFLINKTDYRCIKQDEVSIDENTIPGDYFYCELHPDGDRYFCNLIDQKHPVENYDIVLKKVLETRCL